jgi:TPR repeat protein
MLNYKIEIKKGYSDSRNKKEAMTWYLKSTELGHSEAMFKFAIYLKKGSSLSANKESVK